MQQLQLDLFEKNTDTELLLGEIDSLRISQGKLRRKVFGELNDLQDKFDELKKDYEKLMFKTSHLD